MLQFLFIRYICVIVTLNINLFPTVKAQTDEMATARSKLSNLMDKIMHTIYDPKHDVMPPIDIAVTINPFKTKHVFSDFGDTMQNNRHKSIHKRGLVFQARYVPVPNIHGYTGIFEKGCDGIGRFSYAVPPSVNNGVISVLYGFAMKCLLDNQDSVNFFAMHSLNPQNTYNLFEHNYSNQLPQPTSLGLQIGAQTFRMAKYLAQKGCSSAKDTDPNYLTLDPMAEALNDKAEYKAPHSIICVASDGIQTVYNSDGEDINMVDFRYILNGKGKGVKVFDIYAENMEVNSKIGEIHAVSDFVTSTFGDQELFFQHPLHHEGI